MTLAERLEAVEERILKACQAAGRSPESVTLLPVSKGQPLEKITEALKLPRFPRRLGENYWQEMSAKIDALSGLEWHFLGALQSRKIAEVASRVQVLQTVSRVKELELIATSSHPPEIFLQVNISNEAQKGGAQPQEIKMLLEAADRLRLRVRGLMGMAASLEEASAAQVRAQFSLLRKLRDEHLPQGELSMGMSDDLDLAVLEGATLVRVGSALFGERI